jgi:hypothetical protein
MIAAPSLPGISGLSQPIPSRSWSSTANFEKLACFSAADSAKGNVHRLLARYRGLVGF